MAKKKKCRKKPKPLLAEQGIIHLSDSFVPPSQESGLLNTVGGDEDCQGLVLAPNYGYGIPASTLVRDKFREKPSNPEKSDQDKIEKSSENGSQEAEDQRTEIDVDKEAPSDPEEKENKETKVADDEELSVALLVRHIGGAKSKPLVRRDVVEDRAEADLPKEEPVKDDAETSEFYASLGIARPDQTPEDCKNTSAAPGEDPLTSSDQNSLVPVTEPSDSSGPIVPTTESIAEYYKDYTQYYYSQQHDPYGSEPLEFGQTLAADGVVDDKDTDQTIIDMARRAQRARRLYEAKKEAAEAEKKKLAEVVPEVIEVYDPLPMEIIESTVAAELNITPDTTLTQYWSYVKECPHDFHRWTYMISYVESVLALPECRQVYNAFLPLFPYCFGYWKRYSQIEKAHNYSQRALTILQRGLEFIQLSVDLWMAYLKLFSEIHSDNSDYKTIMREKYELALAAVGLEFRSDVLWDSYIQWELDQKDLKRAFQLYRRLLQIPTRLYNRHWDNFQAMVRDHHPRSFLIYEEYERQRKLGCKILKFRYYPEPEIESGEVKKVSKPEDSLMDFVKERVLAKGTEMYRKTEKETDQRWDFEELIKRPYFHVKALDKRQLNNWEQYLNFEIQAGNHDRTVILFERCVITCAHYDSFWCKYARYVENYYRRRPSSDSSVSVYFQKSMNNVEIGTTQQTEEEEKLIDAVTSVINSMLLHLEKNEAKEIQVVKDVLDSMVIELDSDCESNVPEKSAAPENAEKKVAEETAEKNTSAVTVRESSTDDSLHNVTPVNLCGDSKVEPNELPLKSGEHIDRESASPGFSSLISTPSFPKTSVYWHDLVRDIYKRACVVHCPKKPTIRLQWAAFEEEIGNVNEARLMIQHVLEWFPNHLNAKYQLLELERRCNNYKRVHELFTEYIKTKNKEEYGILTMKYARFIYKECGKPDQALALLRKAIKKDRGNYRLYSHVIEICYERYPSDRRGAFAALELALQTKEISDEQKLLFCRKKVLYLQEHGDLQSYRNAVDQLDEFEALARKREAEALKWKQLEVRLEVQKQVELQPFPVPSWSSVSKKQTQEPIPIQFDTNQDDSNSNDITITTQVVDHTVVDPEAPYKHVPPTEELFLDSRYGYGHNHPETKLIEKMAHQEYQKIEAKGYDVCLKDTPEDLKLLRKRKNPLYIVPPRGSYLINQDSDVPGDYKKPRLQAPVLLSDLITPNSAPCVNVPEWFVKEGGELCLSETTRGYSTIRYWPHFLSEEGNKKMFKAIRKAVKWHQKQILTQTGKWRYVPRLVSWLGPCDYSHTGLTLEKCEDWPPEVLDLIHRLIKLTNFEFNSCSLNLYRTGHDSNGWHADINPGLGSNPPIASVSLGALRSFEMRRKSPHDNFIRFPLFPGSLLIMEGATQQDWLHSIPKEPTAKEERLNLTFRVMHSLDDPDVINPGAASTASPDAKSGAGSTPTSSTATPVAATTVVAPTEPVPDAPAAEATSKPAEPPVTPPHLSTKIHYRSSRK